MKILELCLSPDLGGLELYMQRSAEALKEKGEVVALINPKGKLRRLLDASDIDTRYLQAGFKALPLMTARRLARLFDEWEVDVIHSHWGKDLPLVALAKHFSKSKPKWVHTRQMQITRDKKDAFHNFIYRQMDKLLVITQLLERETRRRLLPEFADRVSTLYYGTTAPQRLLDEDEREKQRQIWGFEADDFVVGLVGRIAPYKGQHLLIEAVKQAQVTGEKCSALIVGEPMEEYYLQELKQKAERRGVQEQVKFLGFSDNPQDLMQLCDVMVLATVEETFGLVLIEAMRCGVAVIGSNRGGVPEIIDHGVTGLLFESENEDSLAQQILRLKRDPALREELARAGKEKADRKFDIDIHYQRLLNVMTELVRD